MKSILEKDEADKVVIAYTPRKFPQSVSDSARDFMRLQADNPEGGFQIDRIVAHQTGIAELERVSIEKQVELLAIEKLKEIQENAYQEAYQLGFDEGRERAFSERSAELEEKIRTFDGLIDVLSRLKSELVQSNETHIMKLIFHMASRVAMDEIQQRPETVLPVLKRAIEAAQSEESITVKVAKSDLEFINVVREKVGKEMDAIRKVKLEDDESVRPGGCIVETNYGSVDASIETRIEKLWASIEEKLPKSRETVGEG